MQGNCNVEALLAFYNASFGGKYELASYSQNLEELVQNGYVQVVKCCNDPQSTHKTRSCKILLSRITEKGTTKAKQMISDRFGTWHAEDQDVILTFFKSINELPPKVAGLCKFLLKNWLETCGNRKEFSWHFFGGHQVFPFPHTVFQDIEKMKGALVDHGLAAYASLDHNTSGPSQTTLTTCPEIRDLLLNRLDVKKAILDEYLSYMLNGMCLYCAKDWLLHLLNTRQDNFVYSEAKSQDGLLKWLKKLENCGYIEILPQTGSAMDEPKVRSRFYRLHRRDSSQIEEIQEQVKEKLEKWFATGEEAFQRFEIEFT